MREIVLDTETTGLDPETGDRIVEIGCVELVNLTPTRCTYHQYINPERSMPAEAEAVHGLGDSFLSTKPVFAEVADAFLEFVGDARLVIHNAAFDIKFLNAELRRLGLPGFDMGRVVDTLGMARRRFPGAQASLDALCRRFDIDNSNRTLHGALLDSELLAEVYLELSGGRQPDLSLAPAGGRSAARSGSDQSRGPADGPVRPRRHFAASAEEEAAHAAFLAGIDNPIWKRGAETSEEAGATP